jgi:hypothetical protein
LNGSWISWQGGAFGDVDIFWGNIQEITNFNTDFLEGSKALLFDKDSEKSQGSTLSKHGLAGIQSTKDQVVVISMEIVLNRNGADGKDYCIRLTSNGNDGTVFQTLQHQPVHKVRAGYASTTQHYHFCFTQRLRAGQYNYFYIAIKAYDNSGAVDTFTVTDQSFFTATPIPANDGGSTSSPPSTGGLTPTELVDCNGLTEVTVTFDKPKLYFNCEAEIKIDLSDAVNYELVQTIFHKSSEDLRLGKGITLGSKLDDTGYIKDGVSVNQINLHKINGVDKVTATLGNDQNTPAMTTLVLPAMTDDSEVTVTFDAQTDAGDSYFIWEESDTGNPGTFSVVQEGYNLISYTPSSKTGKSFRVTGIQGFNKNNVSVLSDTTVQSNVVVVGGGGGGTEIERTYTTSPSSPTGAYGQGLGGWNFSGNNVVTPNLVSFTGTQPYRGPVSGISEPSPDGYMVASFNANNVLKFILDRPFGAGSYKVRIRARSGNSQANNAGLINFMYPTMKYTLKVNGVTKILEHNDYDDIIAGDEGDANSEWTSAFGGSAIGLMRIQGDAAVSLNAEDNEFEISCSNSYFIIDYIELEKVP